MYLDLPNGQGKMVTFLIKRDWKGSFHGAALSHHLAAPSYFPVQPLR